MYQWYTNYPNVIEFVMVDSDNIEVAGLGAGFSIELAKPGGLFIPGTGVKSEIGNGWYRYASPVAESNLAGNISIRVTGAGCLQQNLVAICADTIGHQVWTYTETGRILTMTPDSIQAAIGGRDITIIRGDTILVEITGLGSLVGFTSLDFTVKTAKSLPDTSAILRFRKNASGVSDGLLRLNKAAPADPTWGRLTVDDPVAGNISIFLSQIASLTLAPDHDCYYDIQMIIGASVYTKREGIFAITEDVTRDIV